MATVCLNPEGYLEIWEHCISLIDGKSYWDVHFYAPYDKGYTYNVVCSFVCEPKFWGREILGEL